MLGDLFKPNKTVSAESPTQTTPVSANELDALLATGSASEMIKRIMQELDTLEAEIKNIRSNGATIDIYNKSVIVDSAIRAARNVLRELIQ